MGTSSSEKTKAYISVDRERDRIIISMRATDDTGLIGDARTILGPGDKWGRWTFQELLDHGSGEIDP